MLDMLSIQGREQIPWEKKILKMFWRGRDSNRLRFKLIDIARENPDLLNASITNFFFFHNDIAKYGPAQRPISFFEFFKVCGLKRSIDTRLTNISLRFSTNTK